MRIGTGSILDRKFAGIYHAASGRAASVAEKPLPGIQSVNPYGDKASVKPKNLSGTEWLKHWICYSSNPESAKKVIEELSKLTTDEAYKFLTEPLQNANPAREPFIFALIRRLGPGNHDHTYGSAKANLSIITAICEKMKFTPEQLKKMMCFTRWEKDLTKYESPLVRLATVATYWGSHSFSQGAPWLGVTEKQENEIANEVLAIIRKILS